MSNENNSVPQARINKRLQGVLRIFKRIILLLFLLVLLVVGGAFFIGYYYQDEVKNYIVGELNKGLNTPIIVDGKDIDFTVIQNFPLASVEFKNVKALDATPTKNKDTLFKADKISLLFNIIDVFNENYRIKKLLFSNVYFNIRIDKKGNDNYHFWKPSSANDSAKFAFALEEIILKKIQLRYKNAATGQRANVFITKSKLSGEFSDKKYVLDVSANFFINTLQMNKTSFVRKKNMRVELAFNVDNLTHKYEIKKGEFNIEDVWFDITGSFIANEHTWLNIGIKGKDLNIKSVLSLIPNKYKEKINDYTSEGEFYFNAAIKGKVSERQMPLLTASFGINNASITHVGTNITLKDVHLKGTFTNGKQTNAQTSQLKLQAIHAVLSNGIIEGELDIEDFNNLFIHSNIRANVGLEELQHFAKFDTIETISGQLKLDVMVNGKWDDIYAVSADKTTTTGSLVLSDMNLKIKNNALPFTAINGDFNFDDNNLLINNFRGNLANSDFDLKGAFKNIIGFLLKKNETLIVDASLNSKNIDLDQLLENKEENTSSKNAYKVKFPDYIDFNLNSQIAHIIFRKFEATDVKGIIKLKDRKMLIDPIVFSTMNGSISASGIIDGTDSSALSVHCLSDVKNINVTKMFTTFENFGQTTITDKNIKGIVTANINFKTFVSPELKIDLNRLYANIDMTIEKGELNNVESMKSLSRFVELQELMNMRFSTLKNQFEIKDRMVLIPKMEINSNAINLSASGTHTFNNEINYKIKLTLDELLSKKAKKKKEQNDEFGEVAEDEHKRTNIFLSMTGTVDNPIIKYDTKEAVQQFKQTIKTEKQTVKGLLKEEFGLFKKDTTLKPPAKKQEQKFKIEWEETKHTEKEEKKELKVPKKPSEGDDF